MTTLYDVLELPSDATQQQIETAYREKVKQYHPDLSDHPDAAERFRTVVRAEEVLGDPDERVRYDRLGHDSYRRVVGAPDLSDWPTTDDGPNAGGPNAGGPNADGSNRHAGGSDRYAGGLDRDADDGSTSDHSRNIYVGDDDGAGGQDESDDPGPGEDDWWQDAWDPGGQTASGAGSTGRTNTGGSRSRRRSYSVGGTTSGGSTGGTGSAGGTGSSGSAGGTGSTGSAGGTGTAGVADTVGRGRSSGGTTDDGLWSAEVEHPVESTSDRVGLAQRLRSGEAVVLAMSLLMVYPVFVYFSFDPTLSPAVNVLVGVTTVGVVVAMLTRPAVSLVVFGAWSLLAPLLLTFLGQPVASFRGAIVLSAFWLPLVLTGLVVLAAPR